MNRKQLESIEGIYIKYNDCVNRCIVGISKKESDRLSYLKRREKILEQKKEYRLKNKEIIRKKKLVKYNCPCDGRYTQSNKIKHYRTKKHIKYTH